jgi:molybdopterin-guanine dinucleotide biosynthesis protein A
MNWPDGDPEPGATGPDAAGFVLAGGRSSRMGRDKALIRLTGQPLVVHALQVLREAGLTASIAGGSSSLKAFAPVVEDTEPGLGPLGGICAALASTSARWAVFLPLDLPLLPASLIAFLLDRALITGAAITVPSVNGYAQSFPAVVERAVLPWLRAELEAGRGGCFAAFQAATASLGQSVTVLAVELLVQSGRIAHPESLPAARWFLNVNAPEDLRLATAYRASLIA